LIRIAYIAWRGGRPRFTPGPNVRALGFTSEDLRHGGGAWFTPDEAQAWSADVAQRIEQARGAAGIIIGLPAAMQRPLGATSNAKSEGGYIYFLRSAGWIKIGYARDPLRRCRELLVGLADGIDAFAFVRGQRAEERAAHRLLHAHRRRGEWFAATQDVLLLIHRSIARGSIALPRETRDEVSRRETSASIENETEREQAVGADEDLLVGAPGLEPGTR